MMVTYYASLREKIKIIGCFKKIRLVKNTYVNDVVFVVIITFKHTHCLSKMSFISEDDLNLLNELNEFDFEFSETEITDEAVFPEDVFSDLYDERPLKKARLDFDTQTGTENVFAAVTQSQQNKSVQYKDGRFYDVYHDESFCKVPRMLIPEKEYQPYRFSYGPSFAMRSTESSLEPHKLMQEEKMQSVIRASKPSPACTYCRSMKKKCSSFPGNGRCERCRQKGDHMVCLYDDRWPEYVKENPQHPFYSYIITPWMHYKNASKDDAI